MVSLRQVSFGKEEETRTLKPFAETLRVQSRLAKLDQQPEQVLVEEVGKSLDLAAVRLHDPHSPGMDAPR